VFSRAAAAFGLCAALMAACGIPGCSGASWSGVKALNPLASASRRATPTPTATPAAIRPTPQPAPIATPEPLAPRGEAVDRVVATVDGDPITLHDVKAFGAANGRPIYTDDLADSPVGKDALKGLIAEKLLEQEVKKYADKVDESQVDRYIQGMRTSKHLTDAEFREALMHEGISYDELRRRARLELQKEIMFETEVRDRVDIPPQEIQDYYDSHKSDFNIETERLRLAQILVAVPANATPQQVSAAAKKAEEARAQAVKGADFSLLAHKYSDDESKNDGGELGWFQPSEMMDEILAAVKKLKPGDISALVRSKNGFHVLKLEAHEVPGPRPLEEVKEQIREKLINLKARDRLNSWIDTDLVKQHDVETLY